MKEKNNRSKKFMVFLILFIMISSAFGYIAIQSDSSQEGVFEYKGYTFFKSGNYWVLVLNDNTKILFTYLPNELQLDAYSFSDLSSKVYVAYDPSERDIQNDVNLNKLLGILKIKGYQAFPVCIKTEGCPDIPIVDCKNSNNIFLLRWGEKTFVKEDSCYIIQGKDTELDEITDGVGYSLLDIK